MKCTQCGKKAEYVYEGTSLCVEHWKAARLDDETLRKNSIFYEKLMRIENGYLV